MNPRPEPMVAATNPIHGPIRMLVMNMAIGAKVMVDKGGGIGMAITVVTAVKADITAVKASLTLARVEGQV